MRLSARLRLRGGGGGSSRSGTAGLQFAPAFAAFGSVQQARLASRANRGLR
jgi:hypothetical protein